jgi:hypothetical protein
MIETYLSFLIVCNSHKFVVAQSLRFFKNKESTSKDVKRTPEITLYNLSTKSTSSHSERVLVAEINGLIQIFDRFI